MFTVQIRDERIETDELRFGPNFPKSLVRRKHAPNVVHVCRIQTQFFTAQVPGC